MAAAAPPVFYAQALLRVAESPGLKDKEWKLELIDRAFQSAAAARNSIQKRLTNAKDENSTREGRIANAGKLGLDRLTLQTRAVKAMLTVNPKHARELFAAIRRPAPAQPQCNDALVDDSASYFDTALNLAAVSFTSEERKRDDVALFLNDLLVQIASSVEIRPATNMVKIIAPALTTAQSKLLSSSLAAVVQALEAAPRCTDSKITNNTPLLSEAGQLSNHIRQLWFGENKALLTWDQKSTPQWTDQFSAVLHEIESLQPESGEPESSFFYRKGAALFSMVAAAPEGTLRDKTRQQYIGFLTASNFQQENVVEWFASAVDLLNASRTMTGIELRKTFDALENSGHPALALYAKLEKILPQPPSWAQTEN